jgi:serine/threonine protein kinase
MKYFTISWEDYVKTTQINRKQLNRIMIACINILREIHKRNILHRDIKPANFMFWEKQLFLIDFGMAISMTEDVCEQPVKEHIVGTPKYVSYFIHEGYESRPRDDLISLGYAYMSLLSMGVPWSIHCNKESSLPITHISHPDNVFRKNTKNWENMKPYCEKLPHLLRYFEYCYHTESDIEYDLLCDLFL